MSRFLYLLRHAQSADKQPGQADKERELTLKGMQDATRIGRYLHDQKKIPKIFLTSTADRAKVTTQLVCDVLKVESEKIQLEDELYEASVRTFLELVKNLEDSSDAVMCVGHNPTISYLAEYLTKAEIGDMPPGGLVIIQFQTASWKESNAGTLVKFITPEEINDAN